ncbi:MAG: MBL fold metallo-hydrolase [Alicyclobacillaceae bacterium]|nr:MBL fold metallo-hydrolase [Alicyclobacillaceae bacterium]
MPSSIYPLSLPTPFPVGPVNVYLLREDPVTLVDAGPDTPEAWEALERGLRACGCRWQDIRYVVVTHPHVDHHGMLRRVVERSGAEVLAHPEAEDRIVRPLEAARQAEEYFDHLLAAAGVPADLRQAVKEHQQVIQSFVREVDALRLFSEGDEAVLGGRRWRVIDTPGHSSGHIALFDEDSGELIAGDHLLPHISSNALLEPPRMPGGERPRSLLIYIESLRRVAGMPVSRVYPGHGNPFEGAAQLVQERMKKYEERSGQLYRWLQERPMTVFELVRRLFPNLPGNQLFLGVSEVIGHLDLLESRGQVSVEEKSGMWYYRPHSPIAAG